MKVLVALDGSALSEAIIPTIDRLGECVAAVRLLSVLEPAEIGILSQYPTAGGEEPPENESRDAATTRLRGEIQARLIELAEVIRRPGRQVETAVHTGDPVSLITSEAVSWGADVIAMATHGHSGIKEQILGSVSSDVLKAGGSPVLLIRPDFAED